MFFCRLVLDYVTLKAQRKPRAWEIADPEGQPVESVAHSALPPEPVTGDDPTEVSRGKADSDPGVKFPIKPGAASQSVLARSWRLMAFSHLFRIWFSAQLAKMLIINK